MIDRDELTAAERKAIESLHRLAKRWPKSLALFSNSGSLEIHKTGDGEPYTQDTYIEDVYSIVNDGGDRD